MVCDVAAGACSDHGFSAGCCGHGRCGGGRPVGHHLDAFVRDVFRYLIYDGQRRWAQVYLRGLMLPGLRRKSVQPMAAALGVPEQNLGHFAGVAGWDWHEVTARLAARAIKTLSPTSWVLDDHPFLRSGRHIAWAKKQYAGNGPRSSARSACPGTRSRRGGPHRLTGVCSCPRPGRMIRCGAREPGSL